MDEKAIRRAALITPRRAMFAALLALLAPALKAIAEYERSVKQYPNIKVGEDFTGYKKSPH